MKQDAQMKARGNILINNVFSWTAVYYKLTFQAFCYKNFPVFISIIIVLILCQHRVNLSSSRYTVDYQKLFVHLVLVRANNFSFFLRMGVQRQLVVFSRTGLYDQPSVTLHSRTVVVWGVVLFDDRSDRVIPWGTAWPVGYSLDSHFLG